MGNWENTVLVNRTTRMAHALTEINGKAGTATDFLLFSDDTAIEYKTNNDNAIKLGTYEK